MFFFFNDPATTEIYTLHIVGSVRCVQETGYQRRVHGVSFEIIVGAIKEISCPKTDWQKKNMQFCSLQILFRKTKLQIQGAEPWFGLLYICLLYTSPSPRDQA
eukprot:TRINITY_DN12319_c0_g1_i3.p2 TRINITY_DN12319_c0_g1~~TRINITY_DN12319_c0_g1_i3.p2  ORF type:complete len:103 (-),score=27.87 TRINITY_DN12319_c0_g1_i3:103-411(-)